jgi:hypothetical protein
MVSGRLFFSFLLVVAKSLISGRFVLQFQRRRFLNFTAAHVGRYILVPLLFAFKLWCGGQARSLEHLQQLLEFFSQIYVSGSSF